MRGGGGARGWRRRGSPVSARKRLLVERHGSLGGMASAALVHSVCGLYKLPGKGAPAELANDGFAAEFAGRLLATGHANGPVRMGRVDVLLHRPAAFARLADTLTREASPQPFRASAHRTFRADAETVTLACRGRFQQVRASAWVDATGDAVLATLRGAPTETEPSAKLQRPAFIFALGGVNAATLDDDGRLRLARKIVGAVRAGQLPAGMLGAHFRASPQPGEAFVSIDLTGGTGLRPLEPRLSHRPGNRGPGVGRKINHLFATAKPTAFRRRTSPRGRAVPGCGKAAG